jgi:hypothetical protein
MSRNWTILKVVSSHQVQCEVSTQSIWNGSYTAGRWHLCIIRQKGTWRNEVNTLGPVNADITSNADEPVQWAASGGKKRQERWWVNVQGLQKNHYASCRWNCILNWKRRKGNTGKKRGRLTHRGSKVYLCIRCNAENSKTWHIPCGRFPMFLQVTRGFHDSLSGPNMENRMTNGLSSTPRIAFRDSGKGQLNPHFCALCREK